MAKKRASVRVNNDVKKTPLKLIDNVPKCSQQRRSSPPKRRTDFSLFFFRNSSSSCNSGSLLDSSCIRLGLFNKTPNSGENFPSSSPRCNNNEEPGLSSDSSAASVRGVGSVNPNALLEFHNDDEREVSDLGNEALGDIMDNTLEKSYVSESKTPCDIWSLRADFLENNTAASNSSDNHDQSSDKSTLSLASAIEDGSVEVRGRGKRERRPKVHFGDVNIRMPVKPDGQVRRLRIMRYLGLSRPIGSPF